MLRGSDGSATLADAQRAIANEYGFRTWSDLKAEVDARRRARPHAPDGLAEGVASAFGLGAVAEPMTPVRYEYMGRRWELRTDRRRFVVRPVFDWIDDAQAEVATELQERARAAGVRSPVPVRTPAGGLVCRVLDQSWRVDEWTELGPTPVEPVAGAVARCVGEILATVHEVAVRTDRPVEGVWTSPDQRPSAEVWAAVIDRGRQADAPWVDDLVALPPRIDELSAITTTVGPDDEVLITNSDIGVESVRHGPGGDLIVMHWDFTGPMVPKWEVAGTLLHWTQFGSNLDAARAFALGYRDRSGASLDLDLRAFSSAMTGWMTWLLHRAWEAADPEPSEKRVFAARTLREVLDAPLTVDTLRAVLAAVES